MLSYTPLLDHLSGRVIVSAHRSPDGDAVGSALAIYHIIKYLGGTPLLYSQDPYPQEFHYLHGFDQVVQELPSTLEYDCCFICDTGSPQLLGKALQGTRPFTIVLDHHNSREPFGDLELVDPSAAAVGVLVVELMEELQIPLTKATAPPLWASIYTDTGGFRYGSTDARTLRAGERLLEAGVDPWQAAQAIFESRPLGQLLLLGLALSTIEQRQTAAGLRLDEAPVRELGVPLSLASGFVNYARSIEGVEIAFFVRPILDTPGHYRVSFRSRGNYPVDELAQQLGGGGHRNAAGCRLTASSSKEAMEKVFSTIESRGELR